MRAGVSYLPADRTGDSGLMSLTARDNICVTDLRPFWRFLWLSRKGEAAEALRWFDTLAVRPIRAEGIDLERFSGGNQQKILFAKWLRRDPRVMLLDEPTQGVDIAAKAELHEQISMLAENGSAVIVGSSDVEELVAICHRVIILDNGRLFAEVSGANMTVNNIQELMIGEKLAIS